MEEVQDAKRQIVPRELLVKPTFAPSMEADLVAQWLGVHFLRTERDPYFVSLMEVVPAAK